MPAKNTIWLDPKPLIRWVDSHPESRLLMDNSLNRRLNELRRKDRVMIETADRIACAMYVHLSEIYGDDYWTLEEPESFAVCP